MSPTLKNYLDENQVPYEVTAHPEAYTSQEIAATLHKTGKRLGKVVMVKAGDRLVMCVLPAHELIDIGRLETILGSKQVRLATEEEFKNIFPDCDVGAMPPFGNLYHVPVYLDERLAQYDKFYFEAGSHTEIVTMSIDDYRRLVSPQVALFGKFSRPKAA
ncbi:aminoacyl-tRNA deacylase [Candidatus Manganitrophus noduliformans]|uniref:YbaK/EbsC family protein n=1 Tax=Candidatus Manganitrophus noduliformans TaxID=2606439 RepID=A0A7X6DMP5_9BACT|nr:YbaK/EbsC family protein [Candidatus Manganitrophus noduliformans]NKE69932.1 YbaK/EbsC family protein [Candidatus Manganitrophus noduliformans]